MKKACKWTTAMEDTHCTCLKDYDLQLVYASAMGKCTGHSGLKDTPHSAPELL